VILSVLLSVSLGRDVPKLQICRQEEICIMMQTSEKREHAKNEWRTYEASATQQLTNLCCYRVTMQRNITVMCSYYLLYVIFQKLQLVEITHRVTFACFFLAYVF